MDTQEHILELRNISKEFPGVRALTEVSFGVKYGEVHALVGENGAGKSTLMKILSGVYQPTRGQTIYKGQPVKFRNPYEAQLAGISIIFQEFSLIRNFDVVDNVFLNREPANVIGYINKAEAKRKTQALLEELGFELDIDKKVGELSVVQQQVVEIVKALSVEASVLIMDEPTATLTDREVRKLFQIITALKNKGVTIMYISHRLEELYAIADRVTVLKDGQFMGMRTIAETAKDEIISMMVGRKIQDYFPNLGKKSEEALLEVRNLSKGDKLSDITFALYAGEVLGISGMAGSGRTLLVQCILGVVEKDRGEIVVKGEKKDIVSIRDAIQYGLGYIPEDRKALGILLGMLSSMSVKENITLPSLQNCLCYDFINKRQEIEEAKKQVELLKIKASSLDQPIVELSGGNQQKAIISRWLLKRPYIYIFDEPTRGIDVGAKAEIYQIMRNLTESGNGVLMISSELPEVIGMSDRILVMRAGKIAGILDQHEKKATEEEIMSIIVGHTYTLHESDKVQGS